MIGLGGRGRNDFIRLNFPTLMVSTEKKCITWEL